MDVELAEKQLNAYLDRAAAKVGEARAGQDRANEIEAFWRASEERLRRQRRAENRALWFAHYSGMAESHRRLSQDYERRAEELCRDEREEKAS